VCTSTKKHGMSEIPDFNDRARCRRNALPRGSEVKRSGSHGGRQNTTKKNFFVPMCQKVVNSITTTLAPGTNATAEVFGEKPGARIKIKAERRFEFKHVTSANQIFREKRYIRRGALGVSPK